MSKRLRLPDKGMKVIKDLFLSVLAYALSAVALTFVVQPAMSRIVDDEVYGRFLTLLSVIRLLVGVFITSLANLRMLRERDYAQKGVKGDFNFQLLLSMALSSVILIVVLYIYQSRSILEYVLCIITMLLIMVHDYFSVYYRVVIQYSKLVLDNILIVVGYGIGLLIYYFVTPVWQIVIIGGYVCGTLYVLFTSPYCRETAKRTPLYGETLKKHGQMSTSMLLRDSINYCDRLLIYPILGGGQVSIYSAASVVGKVIQLVSTPVQRVLLSYIVRRNTVDKKDLKKVLLLSVPLFVVAYAGLYLVGRILLPIMYPQYAEAAAGILWIILMAIIFNTVAAMFNTILMRFDKMSIQIWIPLARLVCYLSCALPLVGAFGLMGFCWGYLTSAVVFLGFTVVRLFMISGKTNEQKAEQQ